MFHYYVACTLIYGEKMGNDKKKMLALLNY